MGKRVVDDTSLTALANKLRNRSAAPDPAMVFPADFMEQVDLVHEQGRTDGVAEGAAICATKHFTHTFTGNGAGSVAFHVPFEPDAVQIIGFSPFANTNKYALAVFTYDQRAFGLLGGICLYGNETGAITSAFLTTTTALRRYSQTADGTVTIKDIANSVVFDPAFVYTAIAVKYTNQTDSERIAAFVNSLTGSGTVTLNQEKVNAAFTEDEWAFLIATTPNWTFTWI